MRSSRKKTRHARVRMLSLALLAGSLSCRSQVSPHGPSAAAPTSGPVQLSSADAKAFEKAAPMPVSQAVGDVLSPADTSKVLSRLKPISSEAGDQQDFALREKSLPPPRTGETIKDSFPPPVKPDVPVADKPGPIEITRFAPEGEVKLAPQINVSFNQPMVEVTSHDDLATRGVPVTVSPMPPGKWRWVGTKTVLFEPMTDQGGKIGAATVPQATRFPMATVFTVTVPAGTKSALGGTLAKAKTWTFSTPAPVMTGSSPEGGPQVRDPLMFATFDQKIDPAAVLKTIHIEGATLRLATAQEIKDAGYQSYDENFETKGRWLAFKATQPFPTNHEVTVKVGPGTPSAEGPRKTQKAQVFSFHTYGPMEITQAECGYGDCYSGTPFTFAFTNSIQTQPPPKGASWPFFDPKMVKVTPELANMKVEASGSYLAITGNTKGHVTYTVTIAATVPDVYQQLLTKERTFKFTVKPSPPSLSGPQTLFMVLDPSSKAQFPVYSINHKNLRLSVYQVQPSDWPRYTQWLQRRWDDKYVPIEPPGKKVLSKLLPIKGVEDEMTETDIDVGGALKNGGFGNAIVIVEQQQPPPPKNPWNEQIVMGWVEVTQIGLDAMVDGDDLYGFATSLKDGKPLAGIELEVAPDGNRGKTGKDGTLKVPLKEASKGSYMLLGKRGQDLAFLPENPNYWYEGNGWHKRTASNDARWFVFDDRNMYRPGEEVHFKGYIRSYFGGKGGDVGGNPGAKEVTWVLHDSRSNEISKGKLKVNAFGGFDGKLKLPPTMNLGYANLQMTADGMTMPGGDSSLGFQVQEFRRPEFEVTAKSSEGPHFVGQEATVSVTASYYAGGGLPNADTSWSVSTSPTSYSPPNWSDFTFGTWVPWWGYYRGGWDEEGMGGGRYGGGNYESFQGKTDASGTHTLTLKLKGVEPPGPIAIHAEATVMDVNRQAWTAGTDLIAHPSNLYVGMKTDRLFVAKGEPLHVDVIMTDLDGKAVTGRPIAVHAVRLDWSQKQGSWSQDEVDPQDCKPTSADKPSRCDFKTPEGGTYKVSAVIEDDQHRKNHSELTLWVAGGKQPPSRDVKQEQVTLIPNQKDYKAGDTAELLVQAPWWPAEGILSLRRSGIIETRRFTMTGPTTTLKIPIVDGYVPNLYAQVDLTGAAVRMNDVGNAEPKLPKRPAFASGSLNLPVPPRARTLALTVKPKVDKIEPGGTTDLDVDLKDAAGKPVANGEVTVVVVDEAVLALSGYRVGNPIDYFYGSRSPDAQDYHLRASVLLANPLSVKKQQEERQKMHAGGPAKTKSPSPDMPEPAPPAMAAEEKADEAPSAGRSGGGSAPSIKVRSDFDALAMFMPEVHTDASGHAKLTLKVPDNLTRYRIMAVAVYGDKSYGQAEGTITARLPLMVRPSAPRFLNFGDRFQLPVVLQNQTDAAMQVDVAVRATNALIMGGDNNTSGRRITVPANDRVEVRFAAGAVMAGTARFQFGATSGKWQDAAEIKLPVWTPATTEAFATYGELDKSGAIAQPVKAPPDVYKQFGGLEITTSSTELQSLTDAVVYLVSYPYDCSEQISSRIMAIASLKDVLSAFKAKGLPPPDEVLASMTTDMKRLQGMQGWDGGFGFWRPGDTEWPFLSIHVAHALQRAKEKGFTIPGDMLDRSHEYLKQIEQHIPGYYPADVRRALIAYALYVRNRMGDRDLAKAKDLMRPGLDKMGMEEIAWIWPVLSGHAKDEVALIRRYVANRVSEEAGTAHWTTSYGDGEYLLLASDRRVDGILLEDMIVDQPESDLIAKVVRGLLAHRTAGRWESTQESAWVLLGLDKYFNTFEKDTPDFTSRAWIGDRFAGEHVFKGRTTERHHIDIPMAFLAQTVGDQTLTLQKDGPGRLYYRIGMQYAPQNLKLPPSEHGFTVQREYEGIDKKDDVSLDKDGVWHIRAGAKVRVRLTMVAQSRRYHVALVDPIPAGIEAVNPALAVSGTVPQDPKQRGSDRYWFWWGPWYEHENLRDERVEAFTSLLWEGVYTYSYIARATTPGNFVVPPAKAEEMYHPETFGRSASDRVIVE